MCTQQKNSFVEIEEDVEDAPRQSLSGATHYAQRAVERDQKLQDAKAQADQKNQHRYDEQKEKHEKELQSLKRATDEKIKKEMDAVAAIREQQAEELAKLKAQIDEIMKEKMKELAVQGREKVEKVRIELESKQDNLKEKAKLIQEHLNVTGNLMEVKEKERQAMLMELDAKKEADVRAHQERILAQNDEIHQQIVKNEEEQMKRDAERNKNMLQRAETRDVRIMGAIMDTGKLQGSMALEDIFKVFKQKCVTLRKQHNNFTTEYVCIEPELFKAHKRMSNGKSLDVDIDPVLNSLRRLQRCANEFSSEGSTKEQEFTDMIKNLLMMITSLTTEFNSIQSKLEGDDDDKDEHKKLGIMDEIIKAKAIMELMSDLVQKFNVIGRDHLQETLAIQMQQIQSAASSSSSTFAIQGPPAYERTEKIAIKNVE